MRAARKFLDPAAVTNEGTNVVFFDVDFADVVARVGECRLRNQHRALLVHGGVLCGRVQGTVGEVCLDNLTTNTRNAGNESRGSRGGGRLSDHLSDFDAGTS